MLPQNQFNSQVLKQTFIDVSVGFYHCACVHEATDSNNQRRCITDLMATVYAAYTYGSTSMNISLHHDQLPKTQVVFFINSHSFKFNNVFRTCKVSTATNFPISVVLHLYASSATLPKPAVTFGNFQAGQQGRIFTAEIVYISRQYANLNIHVLQAPLPSLPTTIVK